MNWRWRPVYQTTGGTVAAFAPGRAAGTVFAATPVGVFRSNDWGDAWHSLGGSPLGFVAIAVAPGETIFGANERGVFRRRASDDEWKQVLVGVEVNALALAVDSDERAIVFTGTEGDGVLVSSDGGESWEYSSPGLLDLNVVALGVSPAFASDQTIFAGTVTALYRSRNGGKSWAEVDLTVDETVIQTIAVSPAYSRVPIVLAGSEEDGLFRSDDGGKTWDVVDESVGHGISALTFLDAEGNGIVAATESGFLGSDDGGESWTRIDGAPQPVLALIADAANERGLLAGFPDCGVERSENGAETWNPANTGLTASPLSAIRFTTTFERDRTVAVIGPSAGVHVSRDGGTTWSDAGDGLSGDARDALFIPPSGGDTPALLTLTTDGLFRAGTLGAAWTRTEIADAAGIALIASESGGTRIVAQAEDKDPNVSIDGETWETTPSPFGGEMLHSLRTVRPDREPSLTLASTVGQDGRHTVWADVGLGRTWTQLLSYAGGEIVAAAESDDGTVYVSVGNQLCVFTRGMFEILDLAERPQPRLAMLPPDRRILAMSAANSPSGRLLVAATNAGVLASWDDGRSFQALTVGIEGKTVLSIETGPEFSRDARLFAVTAHSEVLVGEPIPESRGD